MDWTMIYKGANAALWVIGFAAAIGLAVVIYAALDAIFTVVTDAIKRKRGGKP